VYYISLDIEGNIDKDPSDPLNSDYRKEINDLVFEAP
jgi:hypothetical protein